MSYRTRKVAGLVFLGMYCLAGTIANDKYPVFNWALFSYVPNEQQGFTIEIGRVGEVVYDPPLPFSETRFLFDGIGQSPTEYTPRIDILGRALKDGDIDTVNNERVVIEKIFMRKPFSYTVLSVTYDPVEKWKTGEYKSASVLATFTNTTP